MEWLCPRSQILMINVMHLSLKHEQASFSSLKTWKLLSRYDHCYQGINCKLQLIWVKSSYNQPAIHKLNTSFDRIQAKHLLGLLSWLNSELYFDCLSSATCWSCVMVNLLMSFFRCIQDMTAICSRCRQYSKSTRSITWLAAICYGNSLLLLRSQ